MEQHKGLFQKIISDIINGSSHSVDFLLRENPHDCLSVMGIHIRKCIAPFLRLVYRTQTPYKIRINHRVPLSHTNKGRIFALNHRQGDDIVAGANVVGKSAYIVFGNKYLALDTTNSLGLWAYGMILLDRDNKSNRNHTYHKMKYVLEHGGNIIIYPEGYWNLADNGEADNRHGADGHSSENWLIQDLTLAFSVLQRKPDVKSCLPFYITMNIKAKDATVAAANRSQFVQMMIFLKRKKSFFLPCEPCTMK